MKQIDVKEAIHIIENGGVVLTSAPPYDWDEATLTAIWLEMMWALYRRRTEKVDNTGDAYDACPNCGSYNISFSRLSDRYGEAPEPYQCDYCPECGQHLDWSEPHET